MPTLLALLLVLLLVVLSALNARVCERYGIGHALTDFEADLAAIRSSKYK